MDDGQEIGIRVKLLKKFPLVRETLERMGIRDEKRGVFYPSCYCLELDEGEYSICHFKELFLLEGKESTYSRTDELRRDTIAYFLEKWGLVELEFEVESILQEKIDILNHKDRHKYKIRHKFVQTRKVSYVS
jgi:hypothetical protein